MLSCTSKSLYQMKTAKEKVLLDYIKMKSLTEAQNNYKFYFKNIYYIHTNWKKVIIKMSKSPEIAL